MSNWIQDFKNAVKGSEKNFTTGNIDRAIFFLAVPMMANAFNGAGDTWTPTKINLVAFWLLQIPLAYIMAHPFGMGTAGVYWAVAISETVLAVISVWVFRQGKWKTKVV